MASPRNSARMPNITETMATGTHAANVSWSNSASSDLQNTVCVCVEHERDSHEQQRSARRVAHIGKLPGKASTSAVGSDLSSRYDRQAPQSSTLPSFPSETCHRHRAAKARSKGLADRSGGNHSPAHRSNCGWRLLERPRIQPRDGGVGGARARPAVLKDAECVLCVRLFSDQLKGRASVSFPLNVMSKVLPCLHEQVQGSC